MKQHDEEIISQLSVYQSYLRSPFLSLKHSSYFSVYERLLSDFVGQSVTFVEIGVLNGGSLFMWRDFLGPKARIIGIDLNPQATRWIDDGFEIFIGDQSDANFWSSFFETVGSVDVILDDGGHSNLQQIQTLRCASSWMNDGGLIIVEDVHASYMKEFGNPSKYSFLNFAFDLVHSVNSRFPDVAASQNSLAQFVSSVEFYESIVAFQFNTSLCFVSEPTSNNGKFLAAEDHRYNSGRGSLIARARSYLDERFEQVPDHSIIRKVGANFFSWLLFFRTRITERRVRKFFGT